jgi:hypothetical protein
LENSTAMVGCVSISLPRSLTAKGFLKGPAHDPGIVQPAGARGSISTTTPPMAEATVLAAALENCFWTKMVFTPSCFAFFIKAAKVFWVGSFPPALTASCRMPNESRKYPKEG